MERMQRANGYYWAKTAEGEWIIVLRSCGFWYAAGYEAGFTSEAFDEIGRAVQDFGPDQDGGTRH